MRTASPWWASLIFGAGLLVVFVSERLLDTSAGMRMAVTGLGVLLVLGIIAARAWTTMATTGARRRVEAILLYAHLATLLALILYALSTKWGQGVVGVGEKGQRHYTAAMTTVWVITMLASIVPVLMIELSLGTSMRGAFDVRKQKGEDGAVELLRVREMSWSGLTIALATSLLMVTCGVAKEKNVQRDVSYFKTSSPGESTIKIVQASAQPITVHLFFPEENEVKAQVLDYFQALAGAAPGKLQIETHDRVVDAPLAAKFQVTKDGVIVLSKGEGDDMKFFKWDVDTDIEKARQQSGKLRNLDKDTNAQLMKIAREKRKLYLTIGHGEMTNPETISPEMKLEDRKTTILRKLIGALNYEIKDLSLTDLATDVPEDAQVVMIVGPTRPLQQAEWDALDRYLAKGGRLLVALDPASPAQTMGKLEGRLGLRLIPGGRLLDDKRIYLRRGNDGDKRLTYTDQLVSHATTTNALKLRGLPIPDSGALEDTLPTAVGAAPKKTYVIRSMDSSWLDMNNNFQLDGTEKKQKWNIAATLEGPKVGDKDGYRAYIIAGTALFADITVPDPRDPTGRSMVTTLTSDLLSMDIVRWLGGEEVFSGEVVSEDDKPIQHTKSQDAKWFILTMLGAPLLVLVLGLAGTYARRRRASGKVTA